MEKEIAEALNDIKKSGNNVKDPSMQEAVENLAEDLNKGVDEFAPKEKKKGNIKSQKQLNEKKRKKAQRKARKKQRRK